jgi:hypothetical protein
VDYHLFLHKLVSSFDFHGLARDMKSTFLNGSSKVVDVDGARSSPPAFFPVCPRVLYLHHFFLCLSIVCPNVYVIRNFIFIGDSFIYFIFTFFLPFFFFFFFSLSLSLSLSFSFSLSLSLSLSFSSLFLFSLYLYLRHFSNFRFICLISSDLAYFC